MSTDSYEGMAGGLRAQTPWLAVEDLDGYGDVRVTIVDVRRYKSVTFEEGRTEKGVGALRFHGKEKELTINAVRRKSLVALYGTDTMEWRDKQIVLYVDPDVKMKGKKVGGIRIRNIKT